MRYFDFIFLNDVNSSIGPKFLDTDKYTKHTKVQTYNEMWQLVQRPVYIRRPFLKKRGNLQNTFQEHSFLKSSCIM